MENRIYEEETINMIKYISDRLPLLSKWNSNVYGDFIVLGVYPIISEQPAVHVTSNSIAQFTFYYQDYVESVDSIIKSLTPNLGETYEKRKDRVRNSMGNPE